MQSRARQTHKTNRAREDDDAIDRNDKSLGGFVGRCASLVVRDDEIAAGHSEYVASVGARWGHVPNLSRASLLSAWNGGDLI